MVSSTGRIRCDGDDSFGQCSDAPASGAWSGIQTAHVQSCALSVDGVPTCWGYSPSTPAPTDKVIVDTDAEDVMMCGLTDSQYIVCWGDIRADLDALLTW